MRIPPPIRVLAAALVAALAPCSVLAQALQATLTPSNYNGYHISCFGAQDGSITATATGGTTPYSYEWTNGGATQTVSDLAAGYYRVKVKDAVGVFVELDITLVQPTPMKVEANAPEYPNGYNISLYNAYNGSIDVTVADGVTPYTYQWLDGPTTQDRTGLGDGNYEVLVSDANGCESIQTKLYLTQPERSDWTMSGNTGSTPGTHYIGTADAKDVVFKSNGVERLRLQSNGDISLLGNAAIGKGFLYLDGNGILKGGPYPYHDVVMEGPCYDLSQFPLWETRGNTFSSPLCQEPKLGTMSNHALHIFTNGNERMTVSTTGLVGVGGAPAADQLEVHTSLANSGITVNNGSNGASARGVLRFKKGAYNRWELGCDLSMDGTNNFFLWDAVAGAPRLFVSPDGKVGIGTVPPTGAITDYRLYVENGIATRDVLVKLNDWPDYVFADGYHLLSLPDLKDYLRANKHLPGIPSAAEVEEKGGVEVGDLQKRMLETIEQQALYILQLEEKYERLEQRLNALETSK